MSGKFLSSLDSLLSYSMLVSNARQFIIKVRS